MILKQTMDMLFRGKASASPAPSQPDDFAEAIQEAHQEAMEAGNSTYRDPKTGYSVMTEGFLRKRGYCCQSGCRHCPYGFQK